ncbi:MAG: PqqD family protein [Nostoc sp. ChiSLP02]|nr:PqqD family protein [Nostoc sp. DedSLP05]MDZ8099609.1 PqqD family protein [Nostoc sp. DedSLP01]MDZ8188162.1 PqqD family protein [Nostoc sp. ChiSLP02]
MSITSTIYKINTPSVAHETIDGEVVVINLKTGEYYSLLKVAAEIWNQIEKGISKQNIIAELSEQYNNINQEIQNYVDNFFEELQQEHLIKLEGNNIDIPKNSKVFYTQIQTETITEKIEFEPPKLNKFTDMRELLLLDPIHEVNETGWPNT